MNQARIALLGSRYAAFPRRSRPSFGITTCLLISVYATRGCLPEKGKSFPEYSFSQTLELAPVVVYATDEMAQHVYQHRYHVLALCVQVSAVWTDTTWRIPAIAIENALVRIDCMPAHPGPRGRIVHRICLIPSAKSEQNYQIFEPGIMTRGAYPAKDSNL